MKKISKQAYTAEFKVLAVKRMKAGQTVGVAAKELGLIEQIVRNGSRRRQLANSPGRAPSS